MPRIVETFQEFDERHGGKSLQIYDGKIGYRRRPTGNYVYADGAMYRNSSDQLEPPADPVELLKVKILYKTEQIDRARMSFTQTKDSILQFGSLSKGNLSVPEPSQQDVEHLKQLRDQVQCFESELVKLQNRLSNIDLVLVQKREQQHVNDELEQERQQRISDVLDAASEISLL